MTLQWPEFNMDFLDSELVLRGPPRERARVADAHARHVVEHRGHVHRVHHVRVVHLVVLGAVGHPRAPVAVPAAEVT